MKYLVDTDWLVDATSGQITAICTLDELKPRGLAVSIVSVAELYKGAFGRPELRQSLANYRTFLEPFVVLAISDLIAERFGELRASLRRRGAMIPDMDLLTAATAVDAEVELITRNTLHFARIPDLKLY